MMLISYLFFFAIYSVLGWIYETVLCSIEAGHTVNRGFLNGPYCPIYGFGAVLFLILLGRETSPILIFLFGALIATATEYVTSVIMERLFNARWWDYSKFKFNLNGRVCLGASVIFGAFALLLIKVIHPFLKKTVSLIPNAVYYALTAAMTVTFLLDLFITLKGFKGFGDRFNTDTEINLSRQEERLIKAFPTLNILENSAKSELFRKKITDVRIKKR